MASVEPEVHKVAPCVSCHAWNGDMTMLAISPNNSDVHILEYSPAEKSLKKIQILKEHDQLVCALDWAPKSNLLLSCSHDRNAYVWKQGEDGVWQPSLVILRLNRAALCGAWCPDERKFAVGSGAKSVCICYYSPENDWWVSKQIKKKHTSSVTAVAWHPSNCLLATASTDGMCRVFNAVVQGVDDGLPAPPSAGASAFGDCLLQLDMQAGWCHAVAWSPSGGWLAFAAHASKVFFAPVPEEAGAGEAGAWATPSVQEVAHEGVRGGLPFRAFTFLGDDTAVAGGWDCVPILLGRGEGGGPWGVRGAVVAARGGAAKSSQFSAALNVFKGEGEGGVGGAGGEDEEPGAAHFNSIAEVRAAGPGRFSTAGVDGKVALWDHSSVEGLMAGLAI